MKIIIYLASTFFICGNTFSQNCSQIVPPQAVVQNVGTFHITSDTTVPHNDGSDFYVCSGVHLTIEGSAGSNYMLEDGASLTIMDQSGDNVLAKGNAIITDYSTNELVVSGEATVTISKPNNPLNYVLLSCPTVTFDYQLVGGSAPCALSVLEEEKMQSLHLYPNPIASNGILNFDTEIKSIQIVDISGKIVLNSDNFNESFVQLRSMEKGIFVVKVITMNGAVLYERLIVK